MALPSSRTPKPLSGERELNAVVLAFFFPSIENKPRPPAGVLPTPLPRLKFVVPPPPGRPAPAWLRFDESSPSAFPTGMLQAAHPATRLVGLRVDSAGARPAAAARCTCSPSTSRSRSSPRAPPPRCCPCSCPCPCRALRPPLALARAGRTAAAPCAPRFGDASGFDGRQRRRELLLRAGVHLLAPVERVAELHLRERPLELVAQATCGARGAASRAPARRRPRAGSVNVHARGRARAARLELLLAHVEFLLFDFALEHGDVFAAALLLLPFLLALAAFLQSEPSMRRWVVGDVRSWYASFGARAVSRAGEGLASSESWRKRCVGGFIPRSKVSDAHRYPRQISGWRRNGAGLHKQVRILSTKKENTRTLYEYRFRMAATRLPVLVPVSVRSIDRGYFAPSTVLDFPGESMTPNSLPSSSLLRPLIAQRSKVGDDDGRCDICGAARYIRAADRARGAGTCGTSQGSVDESRSQAICALNHPRRRGCARGACCAPRAAAAASASRLTRGSSGSPVRNESSSSLCADTGESASRTPPPPPLDGNCRFAEEEESACERPDGWGAARTGGMGKCVGGLGNAESERTEPRVRVDERRPRRLHVALRCGGGLWLPGHCRRRYAQVLATEVLRARRGGRRACRVSRGPIRAGQLQLAGLRRALCAACGLGLSSHLLLDRLQAPRSPSRRRSAGHPRRWAGRTGECLSSLLRTAPSTGRGAR